MNITKLLTDPNEYFVKFKEEKKYWLLVALAYCIYSIGTIITIVALQKIQPNSLDIENWESIIIYTVIDIVMTFLVINALWLLFIKIFRGRGKIKDNIMAIGYSFILPAVTYCLLSIIQFTFFIKNGNSYLESEGFNLFFWLMMFIRFLSLIYAGIAVNHINGFGKEKTFLVGLCVGVALLIGMNHYYNPNL